eukprot:GILI01005879.1.p1 GENE.GILI01005879.1~~GILI01005879.1.p1  ORF type:complete len:362 (-),score=58.31 GILI01005879.1:127-1212(-)
MATVFPATKYIFDLYKKEFVPIPTNIRINTAGRRFEAGGMRICFQVEEVEEDGCTSTMVAKVFKKDIPDIVENDYFNEAMAQCMCEEFASNYNKLRNTPKKLSFLACHVVRIHLNDVPLAAIAPNSLLTFRTQDTRECVFVMEHLMTGTFTKYNNNFGEVYDTSSDKNATASVNARHAETLLTAEAFSHFTLHESGGSMLVCDLQGVNDLFTDPQIHTEEGKGLGMGNMGAEGIAKWVIKHKCNVICRQIGLRSLIPSRDPNPPTLPPPPQVSVSGGNPYLSFRAQMAESAIQRQNPTANSPLERKESESNEEWRQRIENMTDDEQLQAAIAESVRVHERRQEYNQNPDYNSNGHPVEFRM